jgi:hypothetical protein
MKIVFPFLSLFVAAGLASLAGCSGSSGTSETVDAAVCGKLPPLGASTVLAPRTNGTELGARAKVAVNKGGMPIFAYVDGAETSLNSTVWFTGWDDCAGAWKAPVKIDDHVDNQPGSASKVIDFAVDAADGRIAVAYTKIVHLVGPPRVNDTRAIFVATSTDGGATFTTQRVSKHSCETTDAEGDATQTDDPALVLANGKSYIAYNQEGASCGTSCVIGTVLATQTGGAFGYEVLAAGGAESARFPIGLAVDAAGAPALAAHLAPATGYNTRLVFWRPGQPTVAPITDTANVQNDSGGVSLAFDGLKPRVVSRIQRGPVNGVAEYDLLFQASDDGSVWTAPKPLARPESIAPGQQVLVAGGKTFVVAGGPHVYESTDLASWTVDDLGAAQSSVAVSGAIGANGTRWIGIEGTSPVIPSALGGLVLYRR